MLSLSAGIARGTGRKATKKIAAATSGPDYTKVHRNLALELVSKGGDRLW